RLIAGKDGFLPLRPSELVILVSIACAAAGLASFLLFLREVCRRHAAERHLRTADRQLGELKEAAAEGRRMEAVGRHAAEVARDLGNVLTAIPGFATLVLEKAVDTETRAFAREIVKAGEKAALLGTRLLSIGRGDIVKPHALDLQAFLRALEPLLRKLVREDIALVVELAGEPMCVAADDTQLEQVILNLVVNASDAMPKGGTLVLRTATRTVNAGERISGVQVVPGPYAEIKITDTGVGMDTATLARAFEPFFTTKSPEEGMGLGLSTAYGIVKNSRGYLWLESAPGRGTTATVHLPRRASGD
ncbi:MAG TPA: ATP-binding protein, partial [Polyangiaceae bacterium]